MASAKAHRAKAQSENAFFCVVQAKQHAAVQTRAPRRAASNASATVCDDQKEQAKKKKKKKKKKSAQ